MSFHIGWSESGGQRRKFTFRRLAKTIFPDQSLLRRRLSMADYERREASTSSVAPTPCPSPPACLRDIWTHSQIKFVFCVVSFCKVCFFHSPGPHPFLPGICHFFAQPQFEANTFYTWKCVKSHQNCVSFFYTVFNILHCVSNNFFAFRLEKITLSLFFYTTSSCDDCDKYLLSPSWNINNSIISNSL